MQLQNEAYAAASGAVRIWSVTGRRRALIARSSPLCNFEEGGADDFTPNDFATVLCYPKENKRRPSVRTVQLISSAVLCVCACAGDRSVSKLVPEPSKITVSEALKDVASGFIDMKKELEESGRTIGFFACKAIVTMNVTAGGQDKDALVINASANTAPGLEKVLVAASASANLDMSAIATAARGNTILIEMYNPACIPNNTLGYDKTRQDQGSCGRNWRDWRGWPTA